MGRKRGILGACVALVLAAAVSAAPAQAEPVFFGKAAVGGAVGNAAFTGSGGIMFFEDHTSKIKWECKAETMAGEVSGPQAVSHVVMKMTGCEIAGLALPCENTGAKEITTESLAGELGAIMSTTPGLRLRPESGPNDMEFQCEGGGVLMRVTGSIIGKFSGASGNTVAEGKLATKLTLALEQTGGIQKYTHFLAGGSEQWVQHVSEFNSEKGEYVWHEELLGLGASAILVSHPAGEFGVTK